MKTSQQQQGNESRIITGPDPERGCNRSFAELWRLKVHYRAPPDVRGSGKERGHGTELKWCPKCGKDLKPGKHHVGCSAGKSAPRQAAKRQRQMSTTTESEWVSSEHSDSLEAAVRRQATKRQIVQSEASTGRIQQQQVAAAAAAQQQQLQQQAGQQAVQRGDSCRLERLKQGLDGGELLFTSAAGTTDFGLLMSGIAIKQEAGAADLTIAPATAGTAVAAAAAAASGGSAAGEGSVAAAAPPMADGMSAFAAGDGMSDMLEWLRAPSPMLEHPIIQAATAGGGSDPLGDADGLLRIPSPPPLPPDWDSHTRTGLLFDFDQFDPNRRAQQAQQAQRPGSAVSAPMMTLTSSMSPQELTNPSDEYIWQILFAGENDPVPKRVTAHLHHHPPEFFDDDPLLDSLLGHDLAPHGGPAAGAQAAGGQQGPPPTLESIDAVLAHLHPMPLDGMLPVGPPPPAAQQAAPATGRDTHGHQQEQQQHREHLNGCSTEPSLSPGGSGPDTVPGQLGSTGTGAPAELIQQVPQVQVTNGYKHHAPTSTKAGLGPVNGKFKADAGPQANQHSLSPQPREVEVSGSMDFFGGFL
ncbi:hypothetical protein N2152v2_005043 [Parachlorella kessleri]